MGISLKPLNEQVIVITGASSGIGLETARQAAAGGARVILAARSGEALRHIVAEINADGGDGVAVECDVAEREQVETLAKKAVDQFGRIDTWVNNAGLGMYGRLDETDLKDARRLFDINFWGLVHGSLVALPYLKANGGALINLGSEVSEAVAPLLGFYSASKHAVKGFTDALRIEIEQVDKAPVSVTLIQPTAVNTPFPQHAKSFMQQAPKLPDPMIDPEKVAKAILSAAVKPIRAKKVGAMAKVSTGVAKFLPAIGDKLSAMQAEKLHKDEPARDREGALYRPSEATQFVGQTHGVAS